MGVCRSSSTSMIFAKVVNPLLCLIIVLALLYVGQDILKPLAFSCLVALLLVSPCRFFERQGFPRGAAAMISLILATVIFVVVSYFISNSIVSFKNDLPQMMENIDQSIEQLKVWVQKNFDLTKKDAETVVDNSAEKLVPSTSSIVNTTVNTVTGFIFIGIMVFITTFLLLLYRGLIVLFFLNLFADQYKNSIYSIFDKTRYIIRSYIVGLFIEMLIIAGAYCALFFILGIKYALLLGVIGAILNIIPYIGIFITCVITALISITTNTPTTVVWAIAGLIVIHMIDSNILMPKIMGSKVKINALATILGVIVFSALWGIPGTFMAVPIMAIMKVIFEEIEGLHPFAIIMGDDDTEKSLSKPVIRRIARTVTGRKK
jgi:predicted PurR-regulated permease PerM